MKDEKKEIENEELMSRLSFEVVKEVAPDEIDLFEDIKEEFLKNNDAFLETDPKKREKMLGFGISAGSVQLLTGFVLPIVKDVVMKIAQKKLEKKIDKKEIKRLRDEAYDNAIALGLDKGNAALMADSLAGKLALSL